MEFETVKEWAGVKEGTVFHLINNKYIVKHMPESESYLVLSKSFVESDKGNRFKRVK